MFKTITVFKIKGAKSLAALSPENLQAAIPDATIIDPGKTEWYRAGITHPDCFGHSPVFVSADNSRLLVVQVRERILPAKVLRRHVDARIAELEARQGHRMHRKDRAAVKEEVMLELLPTTLIKPTDIPCMIAGDYLIVGTSSARLVLECSRVLCSATQTALNLAPLDLGRNPAPWLFDLLDTGSTGSGRFTCGASVVLKGSGHQAARFKEMDLSDDSVKYALQEGMRPVEIAVQYEDIMHFAITDRLVIKRIRFSDVLLKQVKDDAGDEGATAELAGTVALTAGELRGMLAALENEVPKVNDEEDEL